MKVKISKQAVYIYYVDDPESDMNDVYQIFDKHFGSNTWQIEGDNFKDVEVQLATILKKYPMDFILNRFMNSGLAHEKR